MIDMERDLSTQLIVSVVVIGHNERTRLDAWRGKQPFIEYKESK